MADEQSPEQPKIIVDDDWKQQAQAEKQKLAEQADAEPAAKDAQEGAAQGPGGQELNHPLHGPGEGLEVAHVDDRAVTTDQLHGLRGLRDGGGEGLFAEDGLARGNRRPEQGEMPCVLGTDDEALDVIPGDGGSQIVGMCCTVHRRRVRF